LQSKLERSSHKESAVAGCDTLWGGNVPDLPDPIFLAGREYDNETREFPYFHFSTLSQTKGEKKVTTRQSFSLTHHGDRIKANRILFHVTWGMFFSLAIACQEVLAQQLIGLEAPPTIRKIP
jgi:hypothetical protein